MTKKKVLSVVIGRSKDMPSFDFITHLEGLFEVHVYAISSDEIENSIDDVDVKLFKEIEDMPGYMRGLEENLKNSDVILCYRASQLSSFQALRSALKLEVPVIVLSDETKPWLYNDYPNILAIQKDIHQNATHFIATTQKAKEALTIEGVEESRISVLGLAPSKKHTYDQSLRDKFRNYIGLHKDEIVVLFKGSLSSKERSEELLKMLKLIRIKNNAVFNKMKIIFAGGETSSKELKYFASDHGLVKNVMFIHQDVTPFSRDLYCASDVLIQPRKEGSESNNSVDYWILEAAQCGVIPIIAADLPIAEAFEGLDYLIADDSFQSLSNRMIDLIDKGLEERKDQCRSIIEERFDSKVKSQGFANKITEIMTLESTGCQKEKHSDVMSHLKELLDSKDHDQLIVLVEDHLLRLDDKEVRSRSDLLCIKADAYLALGHMDTASELYEESLKLSNDHWKSYLGLARISLLSHCYEEAVRFYKKVIAKEPHQEDAILGLGMVYKQVGLVEESVYWFKKAVVYPSVSQKAIFALTQACKRYNNVKDAIEVLETTRELVDNSPSLNLALGQLLMEDGKVDQGKELVSKALSESPRKTAA